MTEKKFTLDFDDPRAVWIDDNIANKSYTVINYTLKKKNIQEIVDCLNELHEENEQLKNENQKLDEKICSLTMDLIKTKSYEQLEKELNRIKNENEQLKEQNQRLSEQKHIYKQDWKHLCIDKELLDSENEGLKEDNAILKHALSRIICEFDEHIAKNSEVRDLIK